MIEAVSFGIVEGLNDETILKAMVGGKLFDKKATVTDLLRFKVAWNDEITKMTRTILKVKTLNGLNDVESTLRARMKISDSSAAQVSAANAYVRFAEHLEDKSVRDLERGKIERADNPYLEESTRLNRLQELIEKAKGKNSGDLN